MFKHKLIWYFIFPVLLNVLIWIFGFELVSQLSDYVTTNVNRFLLEIHLGFDKSSFMYSIIYSIFWIALRLLYFLIFAYLGGYIILFLMSPVLSILSIKVEEKLTLTKINISLFQILNDIMRSGILAIRNFGLQLIWMMVLFLISLIPPVGIGVPFILFFVSAYFYGFSLMDYSLERKKYGVPKSARFMRKHSGSVMAIGTPMALILLIPFVGAILAGFVAILSVVGAALESSKILNQNNEFKY